MKKLRDIAEIRNHLEDIVANLAIKRISGKMLEEMRVRLQNIENAVQEENVTRFAVEEANLHNLLYTATGNIALKEFIESQYNLFTRIWFTVERTHIDLTEQLNDWQSIYQALCEKDKEKAAESNKKHFEKYFNHLKSI